MVDASNLGQRYAKRPVEARQRVAESVRLLLDAVHPDDAHSGHRVVIQLADRHADEIEPVKCLLLERCAPLLGQVE
jgi:hypothetical protein